MGLLEKLKGKAFDFGVRHALHAVEKDKEVGPMFAKVKAWLNGKKTFLGVLVLSAPTIITEGVKLAEAAGINPVKVATWSGGALAAVGLVHKGIKLATKFGILDGEETEGE